MVHQFRRDQIGSRMPLNDTNMQENVVGVFAMLKSISVASFPDIIKSIRIRKYTSVFFLKRLPQLWNCRFPMNCTISFSISKVKMSHQTCYLFRGSVFQGLPFDFTIGRNIIPFPFVDWGENLRNDCSSDSIVLTCDARASSVLDKIACSLPTLVWFANSLLSGEWSGSWCGNSVTKRFGHLNVIIGIWIGLLMLTAPVFRFRIDQDNKKCWLEELEQFWTDSWDKFGICSFTRLWILSVCSCLSSKTIIHIVNSFVVHVDGDHHRFAGYNRIFSDEYAGGLQESTSCGSNFWVNWPGISWVNSHQLATGPQVLRWFAGWIVRRIEVNRTSLTFPFFENSQFNVLVARNTGSLAQVLCLNPHTHPHWSPRAWKRILISLSLLKNRIPTQSVSLDCIQRGGLFRAHVSWYQTC